MVAEKGVDQCCGFQGKERIVRDHFRALDVGSEYGFQKASMESVFDKTLYYRSRYDYEKKESLSAAGISASEYCMLHALNACPEIRKRYEIYREVMRREIEGICCESDDVKEYIENDARFDIVIAKKNSNGEGTDIQAVASLGADFAAERYFRLPTDGTTENEVEKILSALLQSDLKCGKLLADCDEKMWRDGRMGSVRCFITRDNNGRDNNNLIIPISEKVRKQINEILGERQLPEYQKYISRISFEDERLTQLALGVGIDITLYLESDDFITKKQKIQEEEKDFIYIGSRISIDGSKCIEYGREGGPRHIQASPYIFLEDLIKYIKKQLKSEGKLYELMEADEEFNFENDASAQEDPGERYDDVLKNNYFVLRHAFVYFWVYHQMFRSLLKRLPDGPVRLHILSIGCGSKTDALALRQALQHCGRRVAEAKYIGIDAGVWNESEYFLYLNDEDEYIRLEKPAEASGSYVDQEIRHIRSLRIRNVLDEFQSRREIDGAQAVYLVVFPNSISEIEAEKLEDLLYNICWAYKGKKLYLCLSKNINENDETLSIDYEQVKEIRRQIGNPLELDEHESGIEDALEKAVFGETSDEVQRRYGFIWNELNIGKYRGDDSEIDFDKLMENEIIKKALECVSGQKREERKCDIRWKAQDIVGAVKKTNKRKGTNYKPYLLKNPVNDLDRYIEYQIYEVPEQ